MNYSTKLLRAVGFNSSLDTPYATLCLSINVSIGWMPLRPRSVARCLETSLRTIFRGENAESCELAGRELGAESNTSSVVVSLLAPACLYSLAISVYDESAKVTSSALMSALPKEEDPDFATRLT